MFKSNTLCIITGASRGIGRGIAQAFAKEVSNHDAKTTFILTARSQDGLQETRDLMTALCPSSKMDVHCVVGDMSDMGKLDEHIKEILDKATLENISAAVLINNAGTINDLSKKIFDFDLSYLREFFDTNLSSCIYVTSCFVNMFRPICKVFVVNISSDSGVCAPYKGESLYCTVKAARDVAMQMFAVESPDVRVLNYQPGYCDTDLSRDYIKTSYNQELVQYWIKLYEEGSIVKPMETASYLLNLLLEDTYENGAHIDYEV